jgi:small subunit ribosomal protein S17
MQQQGRGRRKTRVGVVMSDKMDKTRVIGVEWSMPHRLYRRPVRRLTRFKAHDELNASHIGDRVLISEIRRLSKDKRWRIVEIVEKAEVVDITPEEVGTSQLESLNAEASAEAPVTTGMPAPQTAAAAVVAAPVAAAPEVEAPAAPAKRTRRKAAEPEPVAEKAPKAKRQPKAEKAMYH